MNGDHVSPGGAYPDLSVLLTISEYLDRSTSELPSRAWPPWTSPKPADSTLIIEILPQQASPRAGLDPVIVHRPGEQHIRMLPAPVLGTRGPARCSLGSWKGRRDHKLRSCRLSSSRGGK